MAKQCNYKKKGFRQMSMEADPYELDSMNTNMSKQSKSTAEAIYGNPQGAMMVGNVQLQQHDTSAYSRPAGAMQQSQPALPFSINSMIPGLINNTAIAGGHTFSGGVGNVQNVQQDTSGYTATKSALGDKLNGNTANDVAFFSPESNTDEKPGNTGWGAGALYRDASTLEAKRAAAEKAGKFKKEARIKKRIKNFEARNDTDPTTNPSGKWNETTKKVGDFFGGIFKKKP